jgi:probable rRNA maturation factor
VALSVEVVNASKAPSPAPFLRSVLAAAAAVPEVAARLDRGDGGGLEVAIRITDDDELQRLNRDFAGDDHPTDVLSFEGEGDHLGDLAISWAAVERQAGAAGHPARVELAILAVHGLLHLLGWDHAAPEQEREMTRLTSAALVAAGLR